MSESGTLFEGSIARLRSATGLAPVRHRKAWIAAGIFVQLIAVAGPVAWIVVRAKHEAVAGLAARATVLAAARELLHTGTGVLILAGSALAFALGSVLLARPFVRSLGTLVVAIPIAAVVGVLVLGALVIVAFVIAVLLWIGIDGIGSGTGSDKHRNNKDKQGAKEPSAS